MREQVLIIGVLPQQPECKLLCAGRIEAASYEFLGEGGIVTFPIPKGFPQAIRIYHPQQ
jgi:hypothetical protein